MWSKRIVNVTRLKCLCIILGLGLQQAVSQNAEPAGESEKRDAGVGRVTVQSHRYNGSGLTTNPISPGSTTTQATKQPFNWEAFAKGEAEGTLDERKELLARRNAAAESEVMPRAMSNKDDRDAFSTLAPATSAEENLRQAIRGATTLPTVTGRKRRFCLTGKRRRRMKKFLPVMSHGKESGNGTTSLLEASSGSGIRGEEVDAELNSVLQGSNNKKDHRLNVERGTMSSRKKPNRFNSVRDKELKESRERRKKLRLERRRRRNRERKRRNRSRKVRKQKQPRNQPPAAMLLAINGVDPESNATRLGEENISIDIKSAKSLNSSRVREMELSQKYIAVSQQRDAPVISESDFNEEGISKSARKQDEKTFGNRESFQAHNLHEHKDNVEKEFSKQLERELSQSRGLREDGFEANSDSQHWSKFMSNDNNSQNPRFAGEKILGYSDSENDLPTDDSNNEVLSRDLKYYHDYVTNGLRLSKLPTTQLHSTYSLPELRANSFPHHSNVSQLIAADNPNSPKQEQRPLENSTKKDSASNVRNSREHYDKIRTNVQTTNEDDLKGDLSCINGTFIPAPLSRHALIKYVKSSTPGNEYLEADYECTPGYYMATPSRRLLCNNRRWVGDMPKCKLKQNPNNVCLDSPCEQVCREVNGSPMCACYKGFRQEGVKCIDINECEKGNGGCEFTCLNTPGSYRCECPKGMRQGENKYTCMDINECLLNNGHGPCQDTCENIERGYRCSCNGLPGTILSGNNHTCEDAGPCGESNAGCSHTCLSTMGRVFCLCPDGFMLEDDWKTCQDVDECAVPDLQSVVCQHGCINTPGSYRCAEPPEIQGLSPSNLASKLCDLGFEPSVNGGCVDIDECSISNGGCLEVCENTAGSHFCACDGDERLLAADGRTCVDINDVACPALNPSGRGYVMCSRLTTPKPWRGRKRVINRPGTKCFLRCPAGYQLRGEYELTCGTNGDWFGSKHGECVRYSKPRLDCPPNLIAEVPPGQSEAFVTFAQPSTDLDWFRYVKSEPSWGTRLEANLVPGEHKVTFIAKHPVSKKQATCTLHITVKLGEAPRIKNCPDNILAFGNNRTLVNWTEPIFTDNVKITNIISNKNPGHLFTVGEHKIHYEASDEAGWTATCEFLVTIRGE